jgi:hypothetical protein
VVIDRVWQSLSAAQIPFGCLKTDVPKRDLDLLEFATGLMFAEDRAVRRPRVQITHACFITPQMTLGLKL